MKERVPRTGPNRVVSFATGARDEAFRDKTYTSRELGGALDFQSLRKRLMAARRSRGATNSDWEDAVQRGLLEVVRRLDRLKGRSCAEVNAYALRAVMTAYYKMYRSQHRRRGPEQSWYEFENVEVPRPDDLVVAAELSTRGTEILSAVPSDLLSILWICDGDGATILKASELLRIPLGTAKTRLRRARKHFRRLRVQREL